jgi:hypothetical protein
MKQYSEYNYFAYAIIVMGVSEPCKGSISSFERLGLLGSPKISISPPKSRLPHPAMSFSPGGHHSGARVAMLFDACVPSLCACISADEIAVDWTASVLRTVLEGEKRPHWTRIANCVYA